MEKTDKFWRKLRFRRIPSDEPEPLESLEAAEIDIETRRRRNWVGNNHLLKSRLE